MAPTPTPLRYTLECQDLLWLVLGVEERTSLAQPPSLVLEVTTDGRSNALAGVARSTASLLIEGPDLSRVVRGWVRYVEHVGLVDSRAHLRLHLVPMAMAEDAPVRRVEAPATEPAMLAPSPAEQPTEPEETAEPTLVSTPRPMEPASIEEEDVTLEHTPEGLRAMRGEDAEGEAHHPPEDRPLVRRRREPTEAVPSSDTQGSKPKRRRATDEDTAEHGTRLVTYAELHATLGGGRGDYGRAQTSGDADQPRSNPQAPVRTGGTQLMSQEDLERLKAGVLPQDSTPARSDSTPQSQPAPRHDRPERKRRNRRKTDDETTQMTWEEIEALHRDRGKPKP